MVSNRQTDRLWFSFCFDTPGHTTRAGRKVCEMVREKETTSNPE